MKLYHGTNIDFFEIDFKKCKPNKDFGCGFYLTDIKQQAVDMAIRRAKFEDKGSPVVQEPQIRNRPHKMTQRSKR